MTGGGIRDILLLISESAAVRALGADININSNPIEGIIGEHDLAILRVGARRRAIAVVASYLCMVWGRFRVLAFYMRANNGGKVSNHTVGPTQSIPLLARNATPKRNTTQRNTTQRNTTTN